MFIVYSLSRLTAAAKYRWFESRIYGLFLTLIGVSMLLSVVRKPLTFSAGINLLLRGAGVAEVM